MRGQPLDARTPGMGRRDLGGRLQGAAELEAQARAAPLDIGCEELELGPLDAGTGRFSGRRPELQD